MNMPSRYQNEKKNKNLFQGPIHLLKRWFTICQHSIKDLYITSTSLASSDMSTKQTSSLNLPHHDQLLSILNVIYFLFDQFLEYNKMHELHWSL